MTITDSQVRFVRSLLSERLTTLGFPGVDEAAEALSLPTMTKAQASGIIDRLKALPKDADPTMPEVVASSTRRGRGNRPGKCTTCGHVVDAGQGWYYLLTTGRWGVHHVTDGCPQGPPPAAAPTPVLAEGLYEYQGQVILVYKTRNDRLAGKVKQGRSFRYQQGAVNLAALGQPVTAAFAAAFGKTHGHCIACAKDLTDERSLDKGYGPVCAKNHGWPWG